MRKTRVNKNMTMMMKNEVYKQPLNSHPIRERRATGFHVDFDAILKPTNVEELDGSDLLRSSNNALVFQEGQCLANGNVRRR